MMRSESSEFSLPERTYCPFKAPSRHDGFVSYDGANLRKFEQRPGMSLVCGSLPILLQQSWPQPGFHLQILSVSAGELQVELPTGKQFRVEEGQWLLLKPANQPYSVSSARGCTLHWIECSQQASQSLVGFSSNLSHHLHIESTAPYAILGTSNGKLLSLAAELAHTKGESTRERLLIESKTLEWLVLILDHPVFSPCRVLSPQRNHRDEAALANAARILESRLQENHSLASIAREAHINEFKLKKGFKEIYGTTVFGFLRQKRMEKALDLLAQQGMSVIETANAVGYSNPSHFARAFKEAHGFNPRETLSGQA